MTPSLRNQMGRIAGAGVFVVLIGIGFVLLFGLAAPAIYHSWRTHDKITTTAKLLIVNSIQHTSRRGVNTATVARYRYQFDGEWYEGNRISIFRSTGQFYNNLKEAMDQNRQINVYLDPKNPSYSVYDRDFSIWPFTGALIMGAAFSGAGLHGLLWLIRHKPRRRTSHGWTTGV